MAAAVVAAAVAVAVAAAVAAALAAAEAEASFVRACGCACACLSGVVMGVGVLGVCGGRETKANAWAQLEAQVLAHGPMACRTPLDDLKIGVVWLLLGTPTLLLLAAQVPRRRTVVTPRA